MFKALYVACFAIATTIIWVGRRRTRLPLPPGPPADPIIGHARILPSENQEVTFQEWAKSYGDIMQLRIPGRSYIVLSSLKVANDLLDKRGGIYSDRPRFILFELMGWYPFLGFLAYGKRFQKHRKLFHEYLNQQKCEEYKSMQMNYVRRLLIGLIDKPQDCLQLLGIYAASLILRIAYGHDVVSDDDHYIHIMEQAAPSLTSCGSPGGSPVDFLPFLQYLPRWFPGTYYAVKARGFQPVAQEVLKMPYQEIKKQFENGTAKSSYISNHLHHLLPNEDPEEVSDIQGSAAQMYLGGADTTHGTLGFFIFAMVLYPECQTKAQDEIDRVVGRERLPELEDRESLPYVNAILNETYRWNSVAPLGVPHRSTEDDVYNGMFIPKGSIVIANARAMLRDESVYSNPDEFNPSRYLPKPEGKSEPYPTAQFGFGRRVCVGRHLAEGTLFLAISSILATFKIGKAADESGSEITPKLEIMTGITSHPKPFPYSIKPRDEAAEALVRNAPLLQE